LSSKRGAKLSCRIKEKQKAKKGTKKQDKSQNSNNKKSFQDTRNPLPLCRPLRDPFLSPQQQLTVASAAFGLVCHLMGFLKRRQSAIPFTTTDAHSVSSELNALP
jgi:hypothetical protein